MKVGERDAADVNGKWLRVVLVIGGILAGWKFLKWELIGHFPVLLFFQFFIEAGLWLLFLSAAWGSLAYYAVKAYKVEGVADKYAAIVLVFAVAVTIFPYTEVVLEADFRYYLADRERVAAMVKAGDPALEADPVRQFDGMSLQTLRLPPEYRQLSKGGGDIVVQRKGEVIKVFFYTFRGILDNFSGFVYVSDDRGLDKEDFRGDFRQVERLRANWFFGASK